jgi:hypothetical protein
VNEANIKIVLDRFEEVFEENLYAENTQAKLHSENRYKTFDSCIEHIMRLFRQSKIKLERMLWEGKI